jgi:hypothetical protein
MSRKHLHTLISTAFAVALVTSTVFLASSQAHGQCSDVITGLHLPLGVTQSNQNNLIVSESGTTSPNTGRISIVDANGNRRTLLDGLPSAINDVGEVSGPDRLFIRGRTLYVAIGVGDVGRPGPFPGTTIPNPNPISSPIFSSILAIQFSAATEKSTNGQTLTLADQQSLANGQTVTLGTGGDRVTIHMVADFPNYFPFPLPTFPGNVQLSNPFGLVAIEDTLYVTDGGRNRVWKIDLLTGSVSTLVTFPSIANPLFGIVPAGGPFLDAVPTGIAVSGDQLLVTLFRGVPFPPGTSTVEQIDPATGAHTPFIAGLKTAIDVLPVAKDDNTEYLVLQHASIGPFFGSPGLVLNFLSVPGPPSLVANCLIRPTSMVLDDKADTLYVSELGGRIVAIPAP